MENSYTPFSPTNATTTNTNLVRQPNVGWSNQNSEFFIYEPMNSKNFSSSTIPLTTAANSQFHHPPYQSLQVLFGHPIEQTAGHSLAYPVYPCFPGPNGIEFGASSSIHASNNGVQESCFMQTADGLSKEQERRILDPYRTKVARINRKLARQRSLSLQRNASPGASNQVDARRLTSFGANRSDVNNNNDKRDLYKICTPDNKRLRVLLKKELKNSDVGSLGRIVLPKREAEANLPTLSDKEGTQVIIKDVHSSQVWTLRYKFWSNNKSRMYVLENTGDFVKQNRLEMGDYLNLYEDESKNLYFSITKVERVNAAGPSNSLHSDNVNNNNDIDNHNNNGDNHMYLPFTCQSRDEEETSLQLLIEQLKHKEQLDANDLVTLPMDAAYSQRLPDQEARHFLSDCGVASIETYSQIAATTIQTSSTLIRGKARGVDDIQFNFDDCYGGLDMLPDVNHYNFSL